MTCTVAELVCDPPAPLHASAKVLLADNGPTCCDPDVALPPLQAPEAVQAVAPVDVQVTVAEPPAVTLAGLAAIDTVGRGATVIAVLALSEPPEPVQVNAKDVLAEKGPTLCEPLVALLPDQPPLAEQDVALVEVHVN